MYLRGIASEIPVLLQDIYNYNATLRRDLRYGQSLTKALISHLSSYRIYHRVLVDSESSRLQALFITCLELIKYLQVHHDVFLMDNTYSTNRFGMLLLDIIG
jgi:hypothetical protein